MDLPQRLQRLEQIFHTEFVLIDRPESPVPENKPAQQQPAEMAFVDLPAQHPAEQHPIVDLDAPQKFITHDAGPRACTENAFDCFQFKIGEPLDEDAEFCPWKVIKSYPHCFVGRTNRPHVLPFFEKIHEGRAWDFFYLYHPTKPSTKPNLLVPTAQFQAFLDFVNKELGIALAIPGGVNSDRFFMRFGQGGTPRPRYLKRLHEKEEFEIDNWPEMNVGYTEAFLSASQMCQDGWLEKLKLISAPPSKKDKDERRREKSSLKRADRKHMLGETQALLGLKQGQTIKGGRNGEGVVFICIDVEALERPPNPVSEVGIAILDKNDIQNVLRGPCGRDWWPLIKAHHLRVKEYSGLVNHKFIAGCPDAFDFGVSTFPTRAKLPAAIISILKPYMEAGRDLVLVGHDTKQDIQYLASIGVDVSDMKSITRMLDSQAIHQGWKDSDNGRGLEGVLTDLGMASKNLHNAGNDAVFTLRALIGVSIEEMRQCEANMNGEEYEPELWTA